MEHYWNLYIIKYKQACIPVLPSDKCGQITLNWHWYIDDNTDMTAGTHADPQFPTIYFFSVSLQLHKVWQRLCIAINLSKHFTACNSSCCSLVVATWNISCHFCATNYFHLSQVLHQIVVTRLNDISVVLNDYPCCEHIMQIRVTLHVNALTPDALPYILHCTAMVSYGLHDPTSGVNKRLITNVQ